ncbi:MAG: polysaccharide deacetylase family protein [Planctomycetales bacterium]|nr:polysaccharide deacetylase family protein [Planctomycetales bacterium]
MRSATYRDPLLGMYYVATLPMRKHDAARRSANGKAPVISLFYHRVAETHRNDWTISFDRFRSQIEWARDRYEIIDLPTAQQRIARGENHQPAVCLTFDDGYYDNFQEAVPWLLAEKIPFTYFVTTQPMIDGEPFPHDEAAGRPLSPNTPQQIADLAAAGVEIGAHTRTHCNIGAIDDEETLYDEIVGSKQDLETLTGKPVRYFAFPYGMPQNMSEASFRVAFRAGFWGVCSAYGGYNAPGDDCFHIQRIHGDPSWAQFRNWMTLDPRKIDRPALFQSGDYRLCF